MKAQQHKTQLSPNSPAFCSSYASVRASYAVVMGPLHCHLDFAVQILSQMLKQPTPVAAVCFFSTALGSPLSGDQTLLVWESFQHSVLKKRLLLVCSFCTLRVHRIEVCQLTQQIFLFLSFKLPQQPITSCTVENRKSLKHFRNIFRGVGFWFLLYTITVLKRGVYMCQKHRHLERTGKGEFTPICTVQLDHEPECCQLCCG